MLRKLPDGWMFVEFWLNPAHVVGVRNTVGSDGKQRCIVFTSDGNGGDDEPLCLNCTAEEFVAWANAGGAA